MRISKEQLNRWKKYSELFVRERGHELEDVTSLRQMWDIAFTLGIPREAYHMDQTVNDNHIETALKRIFPNAKE